jgi:hypothetical protein
MGNLWSGVSRDSFAPDPLRASSRNKKNEACHFNVPRQPEAATHYSIDQPAEIFGGVLHFFEIWRSEGRQRVVDVAEVDKAIRFRALASAYVRLTHQKRCGACI